MDARGVIVVMLACAACRGDDAAPVPPWANFDGGAEVGPGVVVIGGSGATDAAVDPGCPAATPRDGQACASEGIECEYGADPRRACRTYARCARGRWAISRADCGGLPNVTCPASVADAHGMACAPAPKDAQCTWDEIACACTDCTPTRTSEVCTGTAIWTCPATPAVGCPPALPRAGTICVGPPTCDYGCAFGARACVAGLWRTTAPACAP